MSSLTMIISSSLSYSKDKDIIEFLQNKKKLGISQSSVIKESIRAYMKNIFDLYGINYVEFVKDVFI